MSTPNTPNTHGAAGISYREEVKRKLIHLSSLWMVAAICLFPRRELAIFFAVLLVLNLIVERLRAARLPGLTPVYDFFFGRMLRQEPAKGAWVVSGGPYVFAAAALSCALFPTVAAAGAMATMLVGDTAAALIGRRFGKHKAVNGKSFEGIAAFVVAGFAATSLVIFLLHGAPVFYFWALVGVFPAAAVELFEKQLRLDDNFSIPLAMGFFLSMPFLLKGFGL